MEPLLEFAASATLTPVEIDPLAVMFVEEYLTIAGGALQPATAIYLRDHTTPVCVAGRCRVAQYRILSCLQALVRQKS